MNFDKLYLSTFGNRNFHGSLKRIANEAEQFGFYKEHIFAYDECDLEQQFIEHNPCFKYARGFGYWIWKPYFILKSLKKMKEGDILVYLDCGCTINSRGKERFMEYIKHMNANRLFLFETRYASKNIKQDRYYERQWNKMDLVNYLNGHEHLDTVQRAGGCVILEKNDYTVRLIQEWLRICEMDSNHFIDDSASVSPNDETFIEHRHDQSILSLLTKREGIVAFPDEFILYQNPQVDKYIFPFWATRYKQ